MRQSRPSTDGFVPRRPGSQLGDHHTPGQRRPVRPGASRLSPAGNLQKPSTTPVIKRSELGIARTDLDESLKAIDKADQPLDGKKGRKGKVKKPQSRRRKIIKRVIIALVIILVLLGAWVAYKALNASSNIFKGNILDIIQHQPLKEDANGRSNILVLGTSEDDPGHGGAYLTDSMMIVSINQKKKIVDMFSIPRDLYVKYGMACNSGYEGKINEYFNCVNGDWKSKAAEEERLTKTREFVGEIFGLDVQYAVHVNNTVIKEAVDAVGGVDVDIQGSGGAPGILDRNFDWRCGYKCYLVKYKNGVHHLDGKHALYLSMARGDVAPTYGLGNSNFDREKNQQKIIIALKQKAVSTGTFADVGKVTGLMDALGNNLRTTFEIKEIRTLMQLGIDIKPEDIKTIDLFGGDEPVVTTGNMGGASVVIPSAGAFDYSDIQTFLKKKLSSNPVTREGASVTVLNGSGVGGVGQTQADKLGEKGFSVTTVGNAPDGKYEAVEIYQIGSGMPATKAKLESVFGVKVKAGKPPVAAAAGTNFVVIFGKDPAANH